ncbi:hypothetical protein [Paracoccus tegillarcae]|uniref:Uncharacterized protein n=1 Tax=Paracoccus tegillarcae TaxID=1529068 RepID=A0A2K9F083_9RHOB|nr:hypothetical protein [Paracoccus tegillarcae]AUH33762.1 hypothetical protein CUV01_10505 [Paracoccus tegillarcae]
MLLSALLLSWPLQQASMPELAQFQRQAEETLLAGETLAPDYRLQLLGMPPAERIEALIFLRRIGLLTGKSWRVGDMLQSASDDEDDRP